MWKCKRRLLLVATLAGPILGSSCASDGSSRRVETLDEESTQDESSLELSEEAPEPVDPILDERVPAPAFVLFDQDGFPFPLEEQRGAWLVLHFYPESDTPDCACDATAFTGHLWRFNSLDAEVACVTSATPSRARIFAKKYGLESPLLTDSDLAVARLYGVLDEGRSDPLVRTTFIVDPEGRIAARFDDVNSDEHVEALLAVLAELRG